eukprot:TRINITY_DN10183_c0_g1_i1.p1 TRINITY_DN10183_c0_g1~~TRINITY_DN10183_c0_g1_i1.p1  ORF type:complete len:735 (+),score=141.91 TRINITY_DN10183_c0_g1_i1:62-2206(+)
MPGDERDALERSFEDSVIKSTTWDQVTPSRYTSEVRSVFGWTDVTPAAGDEQPIQMATKIPEHQSKIERLPVPELDTTLDLYLKTLEPLLTADEFDQAEREVNELKREDIGPVLQQKLKAREEDPSLASWLEPWWDDSYLCGRDSIAINVNYFFGFESDPKASNMHQVGRAASLLHGAASFYKKLKAETLEMDYERNSVPLCMSQMRRVFGASRIPQVDRDKIITYTTFKIEDASKTSEYIVDDPTHAVVLAGSRFYVVECFNDDESVHSIEYLEASLKKCLESSESEAIPVPVEVVTSMNRDDWATVREKLIVASESNRTTLEAIQRAIMVVVLEPMEPRGDEELARLLLHGAGTNRWFDKHNLIVCKNGKAGINFEHSVGDGATTLRVADYMYKHSLTHGRSAEIVAANKTEVPSPTPLVWVLNSRIEDSLKEAYGSFKCQILSNETQVLQFGQFGGAFIKTVAGMSPDAFVQIAIQLAYFKMFGRIDATYEAASTRSYLHGRTEVVRTASSQILEFCKASCNTALTHRKAGQKIPTQLKLLRKAVDAHIDYMRKAKKASGVDRHLLGLRMVFEENKDTFDFSLPTLFKGTAYRKSSHWNLSTSHCGSSSLSMFGFGPVVSDGFGVGYMIKNNTASFTITSKYNFKATSCAIFSCILEESLMHLKSIVLTDPTKGSLAQKPKSLDFTHPTSHTDELLVDWLRSGKRTASGKK